MSYKILTFFFYFLFTWLDFLSTVYGIKAGATELNPLYHIFGLTNFWVFYWVVNFILIIISYYIRKSKLFYALWIPIICHLVCVVNNMLLVL